MTKADPFAYPPRGLNREEAARYIGVGTTKFDELVKDGRMPQGKRVDGRVIWDRYKLDACFADLPEVAGNILENLLSKKGKAA